MKKIKTLLVIVAALFSGGAIAQEITSGYYRMQNVGLKTNGGKILNKTVPEDCYAYVANGTYHAKTGAGAGQNIPSMLLWAGLDNAIISPQTVIYVSNNFDLEAQGTSLSQMIGYKIDVTQNSSDTYTLSTTISGIKAYLEAQVQKSGIYDKEGNDAYPSNYIATTVPQGSEVYKRWQLLPISSSSDNYVAVNAFLQVDGKYYAPYFASYPFKFVSSGMKAYYVSSISKTKYALKEITSEVIPAKTPVIIECSSNNPANCKIEPLYGNYGSISGNKLGGVYFCNLEMSQVEYPDCRTKFVPSSMRVWAVKNGQLVLTSNPDRSRVAILYDEPDDAWLMANESYLPNVPSTAAADLLPAGAATTITFDCAGGTEIEPISGVEGEPLDAPEAPTKTGYTFTGWNPALPTTFPAEDLTVTAQWQLNQYTITFDTDGGSKIAPITQDYQSAITAPEYPTKEGYTFAGWDQTIPEIMPAENITIKALWTTNKYTITFDTDGGTYIAPISQDYGTAITAPDNPTKEGYTFAGWDKTIPTTMPMDNLTIKALWTINKYTLIFYVDGEVYKSEKKEYGSTIVAEEEPSKTGYTFSGWSEIPSVMPPHDVNITGSFSINQYTITFDTDGGTKIPSITQDYGSAITSPANPTKEGYTFVDWDKEIPSNMPAENLTIKALWQIIRKTDPAKLKEYDGRYFTLDVPEGATVYYTLDGSIPTTESEEYTGLTALDGICTIKTLAVSPNKTPSDVTDISITYFADDKSAVLTEAGQLQKAMGWQGANEIKSFKVNGPLNEDDLAYIKMNMTSVEHLDLENTSITNNTLQDEAFAGMPSLISFTSPKNITTVGERILAACPMLAAVVWNSMERLPQNTFGNQQNSNMLVYVVKENTAPGKNIIFNGETTTTIKLSDEGGNFYCPKPFKAERIEYTHKYIEETGVRVSMGWETISLPFTVQKITHASKGELVTFKQYEEASNQENRHPFWLATLTDDGFEAASAIEAYTPYIISMPNNAEYSINYNVAGEVTFSANKVDVEATKEIIKSKNGKSFVPCFQKKMSAPDFCTINKEKFTDEYDRKYPAGSVFVSSLRDVNPFEAYFTNNASMSRAILSISEIMHGNNVTEIEMLLRDRSRDVKNETVRVYTISGVLVKTGKRVEVVKQLPAGMYIIDGKKIVVK